MKKSNAFFGGMGIGLLIGLLIGLTTNGIVGIIIGTLTTILLAYVGTGDGAPAEDTSMRIGAFGLFCVVGILAGLYLRVTNAFVPNPTDQVQMWMKDGVFTKEEAKTYYLYDRFAFTPAGQAIDTTKDRKARNVVLYGSEINETDCDLLNEYESFPLENKMKAYATLGGIWKKGVENINQLAQDDTEKIKMLQLLKTLCDE